MRKRILVAALYIRVSTDKQEELSPDSQKRLLLEYAKSHNMIVVEEHIYIENGISGRKADKRPKFQQMIAAAKSEKHPFDVILVWKFSRFARNQEESIVYKSMLRNKCHVDVVSISEPLIEGPFGELVERIIEWMDEFYSIRLSGEVIRGMTEKALRQGYQSVPSLGYKAVGEGKPFVIDPEAYAIVEYIFQSYYDGQDMTAIAREVNRRGYRSRRGGPFDRRAIERILKNSFYAGEVTWNGITFQGPHETRPSVTNIFEAVQARMAAEYRPRRRRDASANAHWLSGLIKCGTCGASLGFNRSSDPRRRPDFFQCWRYGKGLHPDSCAVSARIAEEAVLDSLRKAGAGDSLDYEYIPQKSQEAVSEETVLREALVRLEMKERRIREAYEGGVDTLEEYKANKKRLAEERQELCADLQRLQTTAETTKAPDKSEVMKRIQDVYALVSDPDIGNEAKGNALRSVLKEIVFDRKTGRFAFYYYAS